ncbi:MAG: sugar O-acetyltransferase [Acidobacteria bacterium]|nr:sugar O-acetyltransferase [Acidobacteriota bacterium]
MATEREKMVAGELYFAMDEELVRERERTEVLLLRYNGGETAVVRDLIGQIGERSVLRAPFFCDYGWNITLGSDVFLNFNCVLLDVCAITIGNRTQIGPGVQIYAADHPRDAEIRRMGLENSKPVHIGKNVWIGGGAIILPGVTIGDDAIIAAGSIVTHDVPAGATAIGSPARVRS